MEIVFLEGSVNVVFIGSEIIVRFFVWTELTTVRVCVCVVWSVWSELVVLWSVLIKGGVIVSVGVSVIIIRDIRV